MGQVSKAELEDGYEGLGKAFLILESDQRTFVRLREPIVKYCLVKDIPLYNLSAVNYATGQKLLKELIDIFSVRAFQYTEMRLRKWEAEFKRAIELNDLAVRNSRQEIYSSVRDQQQKTNGVTSDTLLCEKDLDSLLGVEDFSSTKILKSKSFELPDFSTEETDLSSVVLKNDASAVKQLKRGDDFLAKRLPDSVEKSLTDLIAQEKDIFLPIAHKGHWVSLVREDGDWTVYDSQPYNERKPLDRQVFIRTNCALLLAAYVDNFKGLAYKSTNKQSAFFDCGTHVVNDWRKRVRKDYDEKTHEEMLKEAGDIQGVEVKIVPPRPVNATTSSTSYRASVGLFDRKSAPPKERKDKEKERDDNLDWGWEDHSSLEPIVTTRRSVHVPLDTSDSPDYFDSLGIPDDASGRLDFSWGTRHPIKGLRWREPVSSDSTVPEDSSFETKKYEPIPPQIRQINEQNKNRNKQIDEQIEKIEAVLRELKEKEEEYKSKKGLFEKKTKFANEEERAEYTKERDEYINKYEVAEENAKGLHEGVQQALNLFKQSSREFSDYNTFRNETNRLIIKHKSPLSTHRDLSNIRLCNAIVGFLLGIYTIYLAIMATSYLCSNRTSYFWRTDAERKIYDLEDAVEELEPFCPK